MQNNKSKFQNLCFNHLNSLPCRFCLLWTRRCCSMKEFEQAVCRAPTPPKTSSHITTVGTWAPSSSTTTPHRSVPFLSWTKSLFVSRASQSAVNLLHNDWNQFHYLASSLKQQNKINHLPWALQTTWCCCFSLPKHTKLNITFHVWTRSNNNPPRVFQNLNSCS